MNKEQEERDAVACATNDSLVSTIINSSIISAVDSAIHRAIENLTRTEVWYGLFGSMRIFTPARVNLTEETKSALKEILDEQT